MDELKETPLRFSEEDLEKISEKVAKMMKEEQLEGIARHVLKVFEKKDWQLLAKAVLRAMNVFHDAKLIVQVLLTTPRFWVIVLVAFAIGYVGLLKWGGSIARREAQVLFHQEVTNQIKVQFKEPRISNIVVAVASAEAQDLFKKQISPQITGFQVALSNKLAIVQSNVDNVPESLFGSVCFEAFGGSDTNRVFVRTFTNGESQVFFLLTNMPVLESIQGIVQSPGEGQQILIPPSLERNVAFCYFIGMDEAAVRRRSYHFQYVRDVRKTNMVKKVDIRDLKVFLDGGRWVFRFGTNYF